MKIFPKELTTLISYLNGREDLNLSQGSGDGRTDSASSESRIIQLLQNAEEPLPKIKGENIGQSNNRHWCDFSLEINGKKHYVDIKITDMSKGGADNTNCTSAIYYVLTGQLPPKGNQNIIKKMNNDIQANDEDFYFLVINKKLNKPKKDDCLENAYLFSLRTLEKVTSNGNNLPFQCVWRKNFTQVSRTYAEAKSFLLKSFGDSLRKRSARYDEFKQYFPEHS